MGSSRRRELVREPTPGPDSITKYPTLHSGTRGFMNMITIFFDGFELNSVNKGN